MFGSDWRQLVKLVGLALAALAALSGMLFTGFWIGSGSGYYSARSEYHGERYSADTRESIEQCFAKSSPTTDEAKECVADAIKSDRESKRAEADLSAQRQMADWAWALLIVSIVQIPLGVVGLVAILASLQQGREGLKIAQDTLTLENRAWLKVEIEQKGIRRVSDGNLNASIALTIINVGNAPAIVLGLNLHTFLVEDRDAKPTPQDIQFQPNQNVTLFSGDELPHAVTYYVEMSKVHEALNKGVVPSLGFDIKVTYKSLIDGTTKESGTRYILFSLEGNPSWLLQEPRAGSGGHIHNYGAMRSRPHDFYT